ncbi:MAG: UDP-N-acetylmuramoyl-L-alanyl-D-glutamate--2,6-diaminopimelate ligase [Candidatus Aeolococcus gillhamiae]|uniref:UDP-N-acetylmuramyl-tripeptide synthetase n=1 Tax=Candidatus Aeolococcus gillhamiae TaxID=3127015 RepID=A0A2W5ZFW4_9BACT|nr:MAG: UDP-N-acetylmuramoyl-L-alanyl-D-glutamate--2,6-diaminopimelate ligase [Candidatus Dormibacter sp. RRmetagenome_bin12]
MIGLRDLLRTAGIASAAGGEPPDVEVAAVTNDSRDAAPGSLFVAIPGRREDGHGHAGDAVRRGATAVVAEHLIEPLLPAGVPVVVVEDSRRALSALAAAFHGDPSRSLTVAGVTGTDGKTTTATMLWAAWQAAGLRSGLVSTVDFRDGDIITPNTTRITTMEAVETQRRLAELRDAGCTRVALETSSHGLEMHRVDDVRYRLAVYTRITSEHLDVHGDRERYFAAKARLLAMVGDRPDGVAVLDRDDDFAYARLAAMRVAQRLTYSVSGADADLVAEDVAASPEGVRLRARTPWGSADLQLQLAGRFNAANALAAIAAACSSGASLDAAVSGISALDRVHGRMERVGVGQPFSVVIDYAHTADSLEKVLTELRAATAGRLRVVFGSAGERDVEKRPAMGEVAASLADVVVVTDEDPRSEDRVAICEQIAAGAERAGARRGDTLHVIPDRAEAIRYALAGAEAGDTVLFAGKGHESSIVTAAGTVPWDERAVVVDALRRLRP